MRRVSADEPLAWEALFERHHQRVVEMLYRRTRTPDVAEGLAQVIFLHLHRSRKGYRRGEQFSQWLAKITAAVLDAYEKRR